MYVSLHVYFKSNELGEENDSSVTENGWHFALPDIELHVKRIFLISR